MRNKVFVYDPTVSDKLSSVRGVGRYLQILKENFSGEFEFVNNEIMKQCNNEGIFINPFFNFLQPPLTMRRITNKQIAVIHDLIPLKYPSHFPAGIKGTIYILLNKLALKNFDLIITDSEASKRDIINILHIDEKKIKVIYPCLPKAFQINQKTENRLPDKSEDRKSESVISHLSSDFRHQFSDLSEFCLYVGDATWNKNLVNLAKAIKIINVSCVFVGKVFESISTDVASEESLREADCGEFRRASQKSSGHERQNLSKFFHPWQKELKEFYELTKDDKRFIFAGYVPDSELIKLYQQATVNILPSRDEGFGFSYLEAAQFSCPSVLSDIPVLKEISNNNALFFDPKNPNDIADKIGEIYFNKEIRNNLGEQAKKRSQFFSQEKFIKDFLDCLEIKN